MKRNHIICMIVSLLISTSGYSQSNINRDYMLKKQKIGRSGMILLTSWAGANIVGGTAGWIAAKGEWKYFGQMDVIFNLVNLGISIPGLIQSNKTYENGVPTSRLIQSQYSSEETYLINWGLDFLYIGTGAVLTSIANQHPKNKLRLRGYGNAIIINGGFLLIFDLIQFLRHRAQRKNAASIFLNGLSLSKTGIGLTYSFN